MLDYSRKYDVTEFTYYYILNSEDSHCALIESEVIAPALSRVKKRYSIDFKELKQYDLPSNYKQNSYILYGPANILELSDKERIYLKKLSSFGFVNVVSSYQLHDGEDKDFYKLNQHRVPLISKNLGVNVIYPDNKLDNIRTVDVEDVSDNIVCETVRIKYQPVLERDISSDAMKSLKDKHEGEIEEIARLYKDYKLWHRAPTDGAIAILDLDKVLITQTKTNKETMSFEDFSLVTNFDENLNIVKYMGKKLPSSDGPEFLTFLNLLNKNNINPKFMLHFHKNEIIRADEFKDQLTSEKIEYGKFESGQKMFEEFQGKGVNYLLLREHGIVWWGDSLYEFKEFLSSTLKLIPN